MNTPGLESIDGVELDGLRFCSMVYELFEGVRESPDGVRRLRLRPTLLEKRLLEELLPIATYVQRHYRPGRYITVRWQSGNQPYDATLVQHGGYVDRGYYPAQALLEVTNVVHPKEHMQREHLEKKGGTFGLEGLRRLPSGELVSEPVVYHGQEFVARFAQLVAKELDKKSAKSYPDETTLVVQCVLNTLYLPSDWDELVRLLQEPISRSRFQEVFLCDPTHNYMHSGHPSK